MGLIKAFAGSVSSTLADQWKEYFYCEALPVDVLVSKGQKRVNAKKSSNTKGSENIISNGSTIVVADGQCMIIVDQGKVVEFAAEPGAYTFNSKTESSIVVLLISSLAFTAETASKHASNNVASIIVFLYFIFI